MALNHSNQAAYPSICIGLQFQVYAPTEAVVRNIIAIIIINSIIAVVATFANGFFIALVLSKASLRSPSALLLLRLALTDVLIGILVIPIYNVIHYYRMKGIFLCTLGKIHSYFIYLLCFCSGSGIVVISVNRFVAAIFPTSYRKPGYHRKIRMILHIIWVLWAALLAIPFARIIEVDVFHKVISAVIIIWLVITCFCYAAIIRKIRSISPALQESSTENPRSDMEARAKKRQMKRKLGTVALITFAFFLAYFPRFIRSIILNLSGDGLMNAYVFGGWTTTFIYLNSAINPVIYLWRLEDVRGAGIDFFAKLFRQGTT